MSGSAASAVVGSNRIRTYEDFVKVHGILLAASGIPQSLHRTLFEKLSNETFDGGDYFRIEPAGDVEGRQRRLVFTSEVMGRESNLFLVDHAWTFRLSDAYNQLQEIPGLAERMASMMCVDIDLNADGDLDENETKLSAEEIVENELLKLKGGPTDALGWLELDELDVDDSMLVFLDLPSKFPKLIALSLMGNKLKDVDTVLKEITQLKHLSALWLNDNPVLESGGNHLADSILLGCPKLEVYNSRFTANYGKWALGFCGGLYRKENPNSNLQSDLPLRRLTSLDLSNRRIHSLVKKVFSPAEFPCLSYLNLRGNPLDEHSVIELLEMLRGFSCLQVLEVDIPGPLGNSAVEILESLPRVTSLNGVDASKIIESKKSVVDSMLLQRLPEWTANEHLSDRVINAMWLFLMTYRLADEEKIDETSVWYMMDELGSALRHSDEPNFRVVPFLYMPEGNLTSAVRLSLLIKAFSFSVSSFI